MRFQGSIATALIVLVLATRPATALDPNTRITQYGHTAWRLQDGVFDSAPNAITQTADGYLWIGTDSGLVKYDGIRFAPWTPPLGKTISAPIYSLRASSDGTLWIGTGDALLSWKNNSLQEHVRGRINAILEDHKGRIWAARSRVPDSAGGGVCQVVGDHTRCIGGDDRMMLPVAGPLAEDLQGNLWIGSDDQLLRWKDGSFEPYLRNELEPYKGQTGVESVAAGVDGSVWVAVPIKGIGLHQFVDGVLKKVDLVGIDTEHVTTVFTDRDHSVWMGTSNDGIYRIYGSRVDHFRSEDGLSSNDVNDFLQDREGNLWVATSKGVDCFRDRRVLTFSVSEGLTTDTAYSILATDSGTILVGNLGTLDVLDGHKVISIRIPGQHVTSLFEDHAKRLWVGVDRGLTIYEHGSFKKIERPNGSPLGIVVAMTEDREQNVWVSVGSPPEDRMLFRIRDGRVQEHFATNQIPNARTLAADPTGGIWLGFNNGNLAHFQTGKLETIQLPQNGSLLAGLSADSDGSAWAATRNGMIHWKNREIKTLSSNNGLPCDGFFSSIRDNQATLWIYAKCGLIGIPDSELKQWWHRPDRKVQFQLLDVFDGALPGPATFQPAVSKSSDGRLWFVNDAVVQMIDPGRLRQNRIAPPVYVEELIADRKQYAIGGPIRFPARSRDIEIDYTALSFSIPQKVRFRYKLEPRDHEWQDAGTRRQVFYSDLPPSQYQLRVTASNNDGVWNERGATLNFSIDPAYYQTNWFRALIGAAALVMIVGFYRFRLYQTKREFEAHLEGRVDERLRIARELHDTLLQSVQASLVRMQVARNFFPERPEQAAQNLDSSIKITAEAIAEGRRAIQQLRSQQAAQGDLPQLLTVTGQELERSHRTKGNSVVFRVIVEGKRQELEPLVLDEVYRIISEVLRNAFQHAEASQIEAEVRYEQHVVRVYVRDNGKGIDPEILKEGGRAGHWGLPGMNERAKRIGGRLDFWSETGRGTEVQLTVPVSVAIRAPYSCWRFPLLFKKGSRM